MQKRSFMYILIVFLILITVLLAIVAISPKEAENKSEPHSEEASQVISYSEEEPSQPFIEVSDELSEESKEVSAEPSEEASVEASEEKSEEVSEMTYEYGIDISPYLEYIIPEDKEKYTVLINAENPLGKDYIPDDLVVTKYHRDGREDQCEMNYTASKALEAFIKEFEYAAKNGQINGYGEKQLKSAPLRVSNAYRSYNYQNYLFYTYYFNIEAGKHPGLSQQEIYDIVATYSNRPGTSEHQSGLCVDMYTTDIAVGNNSDFDHTPAAEWLAANCYRFGFILRYPEDKIDVTGVMHESWHFRFVGRELATELFVKGITLDEYYK